MFSRRFVAIFKILCILAISFTFFLNVSWYASLDIFTSKGNDNDLRVSKLYFALLGNVASKQEIDFSGKHLIVKNIERILWPLKVETPNKTENDLMLITQCSANHLIRLINVTQSWSGPISVSIFVFQENIYKTLGILSRIGQCYDFPMNRINLHLVIPHTGMLHNVTHENYFPEISCSDLSDAMQQHITSFENYDWKKAEYPNNLLRNIGLSSSLSGFVLTMDIDMIPSHGLHDQFQRMFLMKPFQRLQKFAYVVPVFETSRLNLRVNNKTELLLLLGRGIIQPFYKNVCDKCQNSTNYERWLALKHETQLNSAYEVAWKPSWEPFYILPWNAPKYDEQFRQYGFNRISHTCEVHAAGYRFVVLNNAFLLHDGFKVEQKFHPNKKDDEAKNKLKYELFQRRLRHKYPQTDVRCL